MPPPPDGPTMWALSGLLLVLLGGGTALLIRLLIRLDRRQMERLGQRYGVTLVHGCRGWWKVDGPCPVKGWARLRLELSLFFTQFCTWVGPIVLYLVLLVGLVLAGKLLTR